MQQDPATALDEQRLEFDLDARLARLGRGKIGGAAERARGAELLERAGGAIGLARPD